MDFLTVSAGQYHLEASFGACGTFVVLELVLWKWWLIVK